ncbi:BglG family transcription antiterminator [Halalkalibacter sp. AB-rgal2]|uniref:BglG family transcription antiterminator n=1 Tax=Halalkalibacter sp. AB-rgal2 TaxID=3242695 RepID=UPI00359D3DB4
MLTIRQREILNELIINNNYISMKTFTDHYNLSLRSIRQDLIILEEWLLQLNIELDRDRKHGARLVLSDKEQASIIDHLEAEPIFLKAQDRKMHMILMILNGDTELTTFEKKFDVSHNTLQNDISELKRFVSGYHLSIHREQKKIEFIGEEVYIRHLFIDTLLELFDEAKMMDLFITTNSNEMEIELIFNRYFAYIEPKEIIQLLGMIERKLDVEYTDSSLYYLFIVTLAQSSRVYHGKFLPSLWLESKENLLDAPEYTAIEEVIKYSSMNKVPYINKTVELAFTTMYFISSKKEYEDIKEDYQLYKFAERLVLTFEEKVNVRLSKRHKIIEGLALHLKPAIHRMKYGLKIENYLLEELKKDYQEYFQVVNDILTAEFSEIFYAIDEDEIGFILIHLCSGLDNRLPTPKKRVAIVCSSGMGTSSLLESSIRKKFPQATVHGVYSLNDVKTLTKANTDLILSTVSLRNTEIPWMKVSPFLNRLETSKIEKLLGISRIEEDEVEVINKVKNVYDLVKQHSKIENESELFRALYRYFKGAYSNSGSITSLSDPSCILLKQERASWEGVIKELNDRLVNLKRTTPTYADELIKYVTNKDHHFLIADGIVFPHLMSDHVLDSGFSMMTCDPPIAFGPNRDKVWWVILLAATNPNDHLPAVELLIEVVNNPSLINQLQQANREEEVWQWIQGREVQEI